MIKAGTLTFLVVAGLFAVLYIITAPPDGRTASKQYVEDHYDALAETAVELVFRENSLKTELIAEVAESAAEQIVPYDCLESGRCALFFSTSRPFQIDIDAPVQITLAPATGPFGQKGFEAIDGEFIRNEMAINTASLESLQQAKQEVQEAAQEAIQEIETLEEQGTQMLDKMLGQ